MRERENLFTDFLDELRRKEKEEKHQKKEQVRISFDKATSWLPLLYFELNSLID